MKITIQDDKGKETVIDAKEYALIALESDTGGIKHHALYFGHHVYLIGRLELLAEDLRKEAEAKNKGYIGINGYRS